MNKGMRGFFVLLTLGAAACGGAVQPAPQTPTTTNASLDKSEPAAREAEAAPAKAEAAPGDGAKPASDAPAAASSFADPCEERLHWVCVSVALDGAQKIEKRTTLLLGDSTFAETHSGTIDGRTPVSFTTESGKAYEINVRRRAGAKPEVVLKTGKAGEKLTTEIVVDRPVEEFTYVSVIATEQGGKAFVDLRYMKER